MTVRLVEGERPYTWWTAIEITTEKVINLLLREEDNLLHVNDDNELYCDLQIANGQTPTDDFEVGVTTGHVTQTDWRPKTWILLHWETASGEYAQWLYWTDWKLYFDWWNGVWKNVMYSDEIMALLEEYIKWSDFYFDTQVIDNWLIELWLSTTVTPNANFQVGFPTDLKDGQAYVLRVNNNAVAYTMTLDPEIYNPWNVDLSLTPNAIDMFIFLAVWDKLELQPLWWKHSQFVTQAEYDGLPSSKTRDWNLYIIVDTHPNWPLLTLAELTALDSIQDIIDELNSRYNEYITYYLAEWWMDSYAESGLASGKYKTTYVIDSLWLWSIQTNLASEDLTADEIAVVDQWWEFDNNGVQLNSVNLDRQTLLENMKELNNSKELNIENVENNVEEVVENDVENDVEEWEVEQPEEENVEEENVEEENVEEETDELNDATDSEEEK